MTRRRVRWVAGCLALVLSIGLSPAATTIKLATLVPDGSIWHKRLEEMGTEWKEQSAGEVLLRIYPGGIAGDDPDMVRKLRIGQLQAATLTVTGLAAIDPAFNVFSIPLFFRSDEEQRAVRDRLALSLETRLEDKGFVLLHWVHGGWVHLFSKKRIGTVDELRQAKIFAWAGSDSLLGLWRSNGFHPVPLAATDILTGLETGMIDALPTTPLAALYMQWYRRTPYMLDLAVAPLVGATIVASKPWNAIEKTRRAALAAAARRVEERLDREVPEQDRSAVVEMQKRGLEIVVVPESARAAWKAAAERFAAGMRETATERTTLDAAVRFRDELRKVAAPEAGERSPQKPGH